MPALGRSLSAMSPAPSSDQPVTVVTGANSGIGRATSIHLASIGHHVIGTVRSLDKAVKLHAMAADAGVEVDLVVADVADDASVASGFDEIFSRAGRVDHLVNNAGVGGNAVAEECPAYVRIIHGRSRVARSAVVLLASVMTPVSSVRQEILKFLFKYWAVAPKQMVSATCRLNTIRRIQKPPQTSQPELIVFSPLTRVLG